MNPADFSKLAPQEQEWIENFVSGGISDNDFEQFEAQLERSPELRRAYRQYMALDSRLQAQLTASESPWAPERPAARLSIWPIALAASIALLIGLAASFLRSQPSSVAPQGDGFAVIHHITSHNSNYTPGDILSNDTFELIDGSAEIHFFCGARVVLQAPSTLEIKNAWEATCLEGSLRVDVPPAARGFRINTPASEIIDLGTAFGLEVRKGDATVEVFDGEIAVHHRDEDKQLLNKGEVHFLPHSGDSVSKGTPLTQIPVLSGLSRSLTAQQQTSFEQWETLNRGHASSPKTIAHYDFQSIPTSLSLIDIAHGNDGTSILAKPSHGRWPGVKHALDFTAPGACVRTYIPGEFSAITFSAWVKINSLDRDYNALFMSDGYETGEPHWQIHKNGRLMLSAMIDDSRPSQWKSDPAGFHQVYFSPPFWDQSMSGQWIHLASVIDTSAREVRHFVNGERLSTEAITDEFHLNTLRIGAAEIANWEQPFRKTSAFAMRNLNGSIDELTLFNTALSDLEIADLARSVNPY